VRPGFGCLKERQAPKRALREKENRREQDEEGDKPREGFVARSREEHAPSKPPSRLTGTKRTSHGRTTAICPRKPKIEPAVPTKSARVLVALATTGGVP